MKKNIAVILPERYRGGTLRGAKNIVRMIQAGARHHGDDIKLSFGHIADPTLYTADDFEELAASGVSIRPFKLERIKDEALAGYYDTCFDLHGRARASEYAVFNDGVSNFEDADVWIIVSDRLNLPVPPHKQYFVVVYDYIQRYVPGIFGRMSDSEQTWRTFEHSVDLVRKADRVMVTTEQTRLDCIAYAGVPPERVKVLPMEFDPLDLQVPPESIEAPTLVWTTNATPHKNHAVVVAGLERYFQSVPDSPLRVVMTGDGTAGFRPDADVDDSPRKAYYLRIRELIESSPALRPHLHIAGNLSDARYVALLASATLLLHAALYDNGTFAVLEAAWHGVPSVSSAYPAMREISTNFGLPITFFDGHKPASLATALDIALNHRDASAGQLPTRMDLETHTYRHLAPLYWSKMKNELEEVV